MQTVRRNQLVADTIHFALDSPADGLSVQVAVITLLHAKLMQDIHQWLCAPTGINWGVCLLYTSFVLCTAYVVAATGSTALYANF